MCTNRITFDYEKNKHRDQGPPMILEVEKMIHPKCTIDQAVLYAYKNEFKKYESKISESNMDFMRKMDLFHGFVDHDNPLYFADFVGCIEHNREKLQRVGFGDLPLSFPLSLFESHSFSLRISFTLSLFISHSLTNSF